MVRSPVLRLLALARPQRARLALAVLAGLAAAGSSVGLMATAAWLISRAAQHPPVLTLMVAIVAVRFFGIGRAVFRYAERLAGHDAALRVLTDLRVRCFDRLTSSGAGALRSGDLLARLVHDVDTVVDLLVRAVLPVCTGLLTGAGAVVLAWWLLPAAGATLLAGLLALAVLVPWLQARGARRADRALAPLRGELSAHTVDLLTGLDELLVYDAAAGRVEEVAAIDARLARAESRTAAGAGVGAGLATLVAGAVVLAALLTGIPAVRAGTLDPVLLAVVVLMPLAMFDVLGELPGAAQQLGRVHAAAARLFAVLDQPPLVAEPAAARSLPQAPFTVRLSGLSARWPGAAEPALEGIDLELTPGKRIAIVGPSGAGKSTLAAVLLRLLDYAGHATINGAELHDLATDDVRRTAALCAADAHLFGTTLAANLRIGRPDATADELWEVLRRVRLDGWAASLPDGLDTMTGDRLSGGQRRRVALARALLTGRELLILDEPTEHLDAATADALTTDLLAATTGRTTLLITHRLTGLDDLDEILVLDRGRIVQRGRHADLVAHQGLYRDLSERQSAPGVANAV